MAGKTCSEQQTAAQERPVVVFSRRHIPANRLQGLIDELEGKGVEALTDDEIVGEDGLDAAEAVEGLVEDAVVGLVAEALEEAISNRMPSFATGSKPPVSTTRYGRSPATRPSP